MRELGVNTWPFRQIRAIRDAKKNLGAGCPAGMVHNATTGPTHPSTHPRIRLDEGPPTHPQGSRLGRYLIYLTHDIVCLQLRVAVAHCIVDESLPTLTMGVLTR